MSEPAAALEGVRSGSVMRRFADGHYEAVNDDVCAEEPLEIRLGNRSWVVTMRTPGHDEELAAGYLLAEGVIRRRQEIREIGPCAMAEPTGNVVRVDLAPGLEAGVSERRAAIAASCGVCGKRTMEEAMAVRAGPLRDQLRIAEERVLALPERLAQYQANFRRTGGLHAAALFNADGEVLVVREDVGRHNAVDKVMGHTLLHDLDREALVMMVSGRVSFEIVQKAHAAGIGLVAAVSAPSSLAIQFAREIGLTLIGFLRPPTMNLYAHPGRVIFR